MVGFEPHAREGRGEGEMSFFCGGGFRGGVCVLVRRRCYCGGDAIMTCNYLFVSGISTGAIRSRDFFVSPHILPSPLSNEVYLQSLVTCPLILSTSRVYHRLSTAARFFLEWGGAPVSRTKGPQFQERSACIGCVAEQASGAFAGFCCWLCKQRRRHVLL